MDERMHAVHDHIEALHAEAEAARLARRAEPAEPADHQGGGSIRQGAGHALFALGTMLEGRAEECDGCPEGATA
jgi:hypothetical protein